jgi:hypothetical protein
MIMSEMKKWKYYVAPCFYEEGKRSGLFGAKEDGVWILRLDQDFPLLEGLAQMGELGYELVGIQPSRLVFGGGGRPDWYRPASQYIFKQPLDI